MTVPILLWIHMLGEGGVVCQVGMRWGRKGASYDSSAYGGPVAKEKRWGERKS